MEREPDRAAMRESLEPTPNNGDMARLTPVLAALTALSQPYRLLLFRAILSAGDAGLSRLELGDRLRMAGSALTFHLRTLADAQLIETRRRPDGVHICVARRTYLGELLDWIVDRPGRRPSI
jgi:DNA-binding transcriptional ArsR family regulator